MDYHVTDILCDPAAIPSYEWFSGYKSMNSLLSLLTSNSDCKYSITVLSADNKLYQSGAAYNTCLLYTSCFIHTDTVIGDINEKETILTAYPDTEQTILHSVGEAMDNGIFHDRLKEQLEDQTAAGFLVDLKVRLDITQKIIFF